MSKFHIIFYYLTGKKAINAYIKEDVSKKRRKTNRSQSNAKRQEKLL